jgi:hypothetical protein
LRRALSHSVIVCGVSGPAGAFIERSRASPITTMGLRSPGLPDMRASLSTFAAAAASTSPSLTIQSSTSFSESLRSACLVGVTAAMDGL